MKPGYQTTEFWVSVVAKVFSLATALGVVSASSGTDLSTSASNAVVGVFAILSFVAVAKGYATGRSNLKELQLSVSTAAQARAYAQQSK